VLEYALEDGWCIHNHCLCGSGNGDYHGLMPVSGRFSMKHAHNQGPQMVMIGTALSMASMVLAMGVAVAGGMATGVIALGTAVSLAMVAAVSFVFFFFDEASCVDDCHLF